MKLPLAIPEPSALIIDDEEDICFLLTSILKKINIHTTHVHNLRQANTALDEAVPEIIFLDNYLPDGKGIHYIQHIKSKIPAAKIIVITAQDSVAEKSFALQTGADDFIAKPFNRELIYQSIHKLMTDG